MLPASFDALASPTTTAPSLEITPASDGVETQSAGRDVLPRQSSQRSHVFRQFATGVHGRHFVRSPTSASVHELVFVASTTDPSQTHSPPFVGVRPAIAGNVQQPKQSQPLGVSGLHRDSQFDG